MTVVLHDFAGKHNFLISIIPVHSETGDLISEIFLRLRDLLFRPHNCYLVFGGGDGAKANVGAWRLVKLKSSGGSETLLGSVAEPEQLPFCGGSDDNQHNTKAYLRDAMGNVILNNGTTIRFDETTTPLRGPVAVENSDNLWLTTPGDVSASHYGGKRLAQILGAERAESWRAAANRARLRHRWRL